MAATSFHLFPTLPQELRLKIWEFALPGPRIVEVFVKGHRALPHEDDDAAAAKKSSVKGSVRLVTSSWITPHNSDLRSTTPEPASVDDTSIGALSRDATSEGAVVETAAETESVEDSDDETDTESDVVLEVHATKLVYLSSSPVPSMLHVCSESRDVALRKYKLRFATPVAPPMIYFDDAEDILYLPYWSFETGSPIFVAAVSRMEPLEVQRVALDIDKWFVHWNDDSLNDQIEPLKFPHLREIIFAESLPDPDGHCSCCHEPVRPTELGGLGLVEPEDGSRWVQKIAVDCKRMLDQMVQHHPGFKPPVVKVMIITRNGVRI